MQPYGFPVGKDRKGDFTTALHGSRFVFLVVWGFDLTCPVAYIFGSHINKVLPSILVCSNLKNHSKGIGGFVVGQTW